MRMLKMSLAVAALLVAGLLGQPQKAEAGPYVYYDDGVVTPWVGDPPYGVYPATFYRRYHYDYGRYWWYYDPSAYCGGYYGYHPRRWRPSHYSHGHRHCGPRWGCKKRKWRRRHCH